MDAYEKIYKSVCRVCLKRNNEENMVPLINSSSVDGLSCYGKAVLTFASVDIKPHDIFPNSLCNDCLYCLKQAIKFKLKCETSDKQLKKLASSSLSGTEIKSKVVEYAMFTNYFTSEDIEGSYSSEIKYEAKSHLFMHKIASIENFNTLETASHDSTSDDFPEISNGYSPPRPSYFDEKHTQSQEDEDAILDRIEKLIGMHPDISSIKFNRKRTFIRHKKFARRQQLVMRKGLQNFTCNVCQRVLANKHSYDNHMQRHNGCRFVCEHCGKGFPVLAELNIHQVSVHGTGPYLQCRQCPYKAPRRFNLTEHERIHTGERPYTCEKCGLTFRRRFVWKKHLIYHKEKTVQCNLCPRKFYLRSEMLAHCNNVHERIYVYLCNKCGATYAKTATVRRHLMERHGIPREMQGKIIRINKGKGDFPE